MKIVAVKDIPEAKPVPEDDPAAVFKICKQMEQACRKHQGLGLSAVQVGLDWELFVVRLDYPSNPDEYRYFVNCTYDPIGEDKKPNVEGCLSLPGETYIVSRWEKVKISGRELVVKDGKPEFVEYASELADLPSIVFQHEIDHARGVLISDIGNKVHLRRVT